MSKDAAATPLLITSTTAATVVTISFILQQLDATHAGNGFNIDSRMSISSAH
jgi:hypothetical protein